MKKLLATTLALTMAMSLSVPAFAAESPTTIGEGSANITVSGTFKAQEGAAEKVSVNIQWESMEFEYNAGNKGIWDETSHSYKETVAPSWKVRNSTNTSSAIIVTNNSNVAITATFAFTKDASITETVTGKFTGEALTNSTLSLESADQDKYRASEDQAVTSPYATVSFAPEGKITSYQPNLGTITISIAKQVNQ